MSPKWWMMVGMSKPLNDVVTDERVVVTYARESDGAVLARVAGRMVQDPQSSGIKLVFVPDKTETIASDYRLGE